LRGLKKRWNETDPPESDPGRNLGFKASKKPFREGTYEATQTSQSNQPIFILIKPSAQPALLGERGRKTCLNGNFNRTRFIRLLKLAAKPAFTG
jgi:hypothetical protein